MRIALILATLLITTNVYAGEIRRLTPQEMNNKKPVSITEDPADILNIPSPESIVAAQSAQNAQLEYMMEHYTTEQMAQYAIRISRAHIAAARKAGTPPPARLTKEQLSSKEALRDYLRSMYNYTY